jgi:tRNA(His) 5'-end guanylyltransferase
MNATLLERLRGFRIPGVVPVPADAQIVARLRGIDVDGLLRSPDLGFAHPFDPRFAKLILRTASHLLGGDACGRYGFAEHGEFSMALDRDAVKARWSDAGELQNFLVGLASTRMSTLVSAEALFSCHLFAFNTPELVVSYFIWRQQEANLRALDLYCTHVLAQERSPEEIAKLLEGLGAREKEEILRQNGIEYSGLPAWQRCGAAVHLAEDGKVAVETDLPRDSAYAPYVQQYVG